MKMLVLPLFFLISGLTARAAILPDIFYSTENEQKKFCEDNKFQTEEFWRKLMSDAIDFHVEGESPVVQNSFATLSYFELFKLPSKFPSSTFMGYVYANGSHHLGRLVRFSKWPKDHPFRETDQRLVQGFALRLIAQSASHELSRRLMHYSLALYKELSWSLASAHLCGRNYTLRFVSNPDLIDAFNSSSLEEFVSSFVTYEQSYLQKTMYADFIIRSATKAGVLDDMRFLSFNGEKQISFRDWCREQSCKTTSFDATNRISFDIFSILMELEITKSRREALLVRTGNARILDTAYIFAH